MADHPGAALLVETLCAPDAQQVLVVHGRAGAGKSNVVMDALDDLIHRGWVAGVLRMDAVGAASTSAVTAGIASHLSDSPVVAIDKPVGDASRVLVIDQLDAVSTYSGRMPDSYDAVAEMLEQLDEHPRVKVVLVVRTVDLTADPRMRSLLRDEARVRSLEIGDLELAAVHKALEGGGVEVSSLPSATLELLRVPLHLSVFSHLDHASQRVPYKTLPDLYEQFTSQIRQSVETELGSLHWHTIVTSLVSYMNDNESLQAPAAVLDAVPRREVSALVSAGLLVEDTASVGFFHETYFDFQFARAFLAQGRDLHDFLVESGQHLFRRAQARQVLEHIAGTDRNLFRAVAVRLLSSPALRAHLLDVVIGVLSQLEANADDWLAIEPLVFGECRRSGRLAGLLSQTQWFDAADAAKRWEPLLANDETAGVAAHQLIFAARRRAERVAELVRPYVATAEQWNQRLRAMVQWSLTPGLVDLTVELIQRGILDEVRGPIAVNSDFWSIIYPIKDDDPVGAARIIGAYLRRTWVRAQAEGSSDPFESGHLNEHSSSGGGSTITDVAAAAPDQFLTEVLPFVVDILNATSTDTGAAGLRSSPRWSHRYLNSTPQIDQALFSGLETAICNTAAELHRTRNELINTLASSDLEALRFLACRAYTAVAVHTSNQAIDWLMADQQNLRLGWSDSPSWASRQLIEAATPHCDEHRLTTLCDALLTYYPGWETTVDGRHARGHSQYRLLSAVAPERLPPSCTRRLAELERRFPDAPPNPPRELEAHWVGPPVAEQASTFMTDEDWRRAIHKHHSHRTNYSTTPPAGGVRELAGMLGRRAEIQPERFAHLALTFDATTPAVHIVHVIEAAASKIPISLLTQLCEHAAQTAGPEAGRAICRAVCKVAGEANDELIQLLEHYANDADPGEEIARTLSNSGKFYYNGDLRNAGMNCTRGAAAEAMGEVLFQQRHYADRLLPAITMLAADPIMAVRVQAAIGVTALLNTHPETALDIAHELFNTTPDDILASQPAARLLTYAVLRAPQRFAPHLAQALSGPDTVAELSGQVWAVALINNCVDESLRDEPSFMSIAARRGAAGVLAASPDAKPEALSILFDDEDETVRAVAANAVRRLSNVDTTTAHTLVSAFTASSAFTDHYGTLFHALASSLQLLPEAVLDACDLAIQVAGSGMGDFSTRHAAAGPDMITVVLRLYRQANQEIRARCLDIIDRLSDNSAYGLEDALRTER
ncbi:hypothetical protein C8D87_1201 [Lentzea atacamensis]|uniref:Uncharacterized protein n=1 Tax=Lentzea atacamensis TaxID=531938 RepID=A0ABX9DWS4_9PSEU|nr:hypothetical protein [Lentzea atacamensis]RAS57878.1 hypothetical protein C8D87_1201 [Lentzea atacamensis]